MPHFRYLFMLLLIGFITCHPVFADFDDDSEGNSQDRNPVYTLYDDVKLTSATKYQYGSSRMMIKSVYPQLSSDMMEEGIELFNSQVQEIVDDEVTRFKQQVKDQRALQKKLPKSVVKNELFIDFNTSFVKSNQDHLISIRFSIQGFLGGMAHPYHYHRVLNFNLDNGQQISLDNIFMPDTDFLSVLSDYTANALSRRLENKEMIAQGTAPKIENFKNWNIKPDGLLITFDEYQVAPYVNGAQTVLVPYSVLKPFIAPDSPIAYCIKRPKKCRMNNLLTGGFIDEAALNAKHGRFNPVFR